jgi:CDP-diacylglycerol--serine O-phosphatidyltransferase
MRFLKHIPNAITCGNLMCGCLALIQIFEGEFILASYLVGLAMVLDFFDGFAARLLKVSSPIGKDLDSLADMVTFGLVPGFMMYTFIKLCIPGNLMAAFMGRGLQTLFEVPKFPSYLAYFAFIIPVLSAVRLAKFNNDTRQSDSFIGLPTPANAMFICSLPLIANKHMNDFPVGDWLFNPWTYVVMSVVMSLLLVTELPLIALKFKQFGWKGNEIRYVFLGLCALLLAFLQVTAIPFIILLYILLSIVNNIFLKKKV